MGVEIAPGIDLTVVPTKKFKTIQITIRFLTTLTERNLNQRSLLAAVLENSSKLYPTPKEMNEVLANLYGATFGVDVLRRGKVHEIAFTMNIVNDKYVHANNQLFLQALEFLKEIILNPVIEGHEFNKTICSRERHHLKNYIRSIKEDKQDETLINLQEQYFVDPAQKTLIYGNEEVLDSITPEELYHAYQDMLNNKVSIVVVGDVIQDEVKEYVEKIGLAQHNSDKKLDYFYCQELKTNVDEVINKVQAKQSKLALAYQTGIYYDKVSYYPLLVFNGLFGGFPHSKLFMNIREKESMAYYASSYVDTYRGELVVQSGIARENKDQVIKLISEQLQALCDGDFTNDELEQTKTMLVGQYLNRLDRIQALREQAVLQTTFPDTKFDVDDYSNRIQSVSKEDVKSVAKQIKLQNIYFLEGSGN